MQSNRAYKFTKVNPFVVLVSLVFIIIALIWILKGVFKVISWASPFLFIAAVVINYKVVLGYGKWLIDTVKRNVIFGLVAIFFSIIGFPIVSLFLLFRALSSRGVTERSNSAKGEFISYEEVEEDFLDISDLQNQKKQLDNDYNDLLK